MKNSSMVSLISLVLKLRAVNSGSAVRFSYETFINYSHNYENNYKNWSSSIVAIFFTTNEKTRVQFSSRSRPYGEMDITKIF